MPMQEHRPFSVSGPLGEDVLLLLRMTGSEALGQLFTYDLVLLSLDHSIKIEDVLGQHMTVKAETRKGGVRYFDGVVARFSYAGSYGKFAKYEAVLRPWMWVLTRSADCAIHQGKNSLDILKEVCGDHGFSDLDLTKVAPPPVREYCTQYRESAFNFISRLLEHDGFYYYFKHEPGKHTLVVANGVGCHATVPNYDTLQFYPEAGATSFEDDRLLEWYVTQEIQTGTFIHTDYDFVKPKAKLETRSAVSRKNAHADMEVFDYPGSYLETGPGEDLAKFRIEERQAQYEIAHGSGTIRGLGVGDLFALTEHKRGSLNKTYLITSAVYELVNPDYEPIPNAVTEPRFSARITAIDDKTQYRQPRLTHRPTVQGPQTAVVTGSGSDVWTDEYGRVKVHFHWDHKGSSDEKSSCWVRVSQNWAGKNWGGMFLPHIGQEVIVDFLEGDPDQPIITGRVYNNDNMPPLSLPGHKLNSIIRDNYGNQIIFDATPGGEHLVLQSPHHASTISLGKSVQWETKSDSKSFTSGTCWSQTIGSTASAMLGNAFSFTGGASESITIGATVSVMVGFKIAVHAATKLAADVGGSMTFNYNYSYKWGWSAETNVNKKQFLRSSGSDIIHDSLKSVVCVGGEKDNSIVDVGQDEILLSYGEDPSSGTVNPQAVSAGRAFLATMTGAAAAAVAGGTALSAGLRSLDSAWDEGAVKTGSERDNSPLANGTPYLATMVGAGIGAAAAWAATFAQMKAIMDAVGKQKAKQKTVYSTMQLSKFKIDLRKKDGDAEKAHVMMTDDAIEIVCPDGEIELKANKIILNAADGVIIEQNKMKTKDSSHSWNM